MHPGCSIFIGFGGFSNEVNLPEKFESIFSDEENPKVMTPNGKVIKFKIDGDDISGGDPNVKYFRQIQDFSCYGFEIASLDTVAEVDLADLARKAEYWLPYVNKIAKKYGITMEPKVYVLSYAA